ncbi:MAG: hypothetical protein IPH00_07535 [Flavobacteriales bacterium]|nr:hypothetical protein [Flavobacteriales bacterium]
MARSHNEIWSMTMGRDGTIWLGTMDGLCRFDPSAPAYRTGRSAPGPKHSPPYLFQQCGPTTPRPCSPHAHHVHPGGQQGNIWLGRDAGGLFKFDPSAMVDGSGTAFTHYTTEDGLSDNSVTGFDGGQQGNLWIGSSFGGVSRYNGKTFENFTKDGVIEGMEVGAFYEDKKGHLVRC